MKNSLFFIILIIAQNQMTIFDFTEKSDCIKWRIVDDVVMGGNSNGNFNLNNSGNGLFTGHVSLDNNGGFSMVQYPFNAKDISDFSKACIKLKGDRKAYQFRVKSSNDDYYSYVVHFETSGDWETIEIPFNTMYPSFRGRKLNAPNFPGKQLEMIAFLIGNKRAEDFKLEIDSIILK